MRFMLIMKGSKASEAGTTPSEEQLAAMTKYNEELMKAGVLLDLAGLHPTSKGARVKISGGKRTVIDGPFTETKELIAGHWTIQVKSKEEATEWAKHIPFGAGAPLGAEVEGEVEIRQVFEPEDFAPSETLERARELGKHLEKSRRSR